MPSTLNKKIRERKVDGNNKKLIITLGKPHKSNSADSISRWVKQELTNVRLDTNIYKATT